MTDKTAETGSTAGTTEFMGLVGAGWKSLEQLDTLTRSILERLQQERQAEVELGIALLKCPTPIEAYLLYTKWLAARTTALMQEGPRLAALWTELYAARSPDPPPPGEWT